MLVNGLLRIFLVVCSVLVLFFVMRRLRRSTLEIADSIFWLVVSAALIVVAVFPQIAYWVSDVLGFESPSNFVFASGIIVLLVRTFTQDQRICELKKKLVMLARDRALDERK